MQRLNVKHKVLVDNIEKSPDVLTQRIYWAGWVLRDLSEL